MAAVVSDEAGDVNMKSASGELLSTNIKSNDDIRSKQCTVESRKRSSCNSCDFTTDRRGHYSQYTARRCRGNSEQPPVTVNHLEMDLLSGDEAKLHLDKDASNDIDTGVISAPSCEEKLDTATELGGHLCDDTSAKDQISCRICSAGFVYTSSINFTAVFK